MYIHFGVLAPDWHRRVPVTDIVPEFPADTNRHEGPLRLCRYYYLVDQPCAFRDPWIRQRTQKLCTLHRSDTIAPPIGHHFDPRVNFWHAVLLDMLQLSFTFQNTRTTLPKLLTHPKIASTSISCCIAKFLGTRHRPRERAAEPRLSYRIAHDGHLLPARRRDGSEKEESFVLEFDRGSFPRKMSPQILFQLRRFRAHTAPFTALITQLCPWCQSKAGR